jgi:hypothetical protein
MSHAKLQGVSVSAVIAKLGQISGFDLMSEMAKFCRKFSHSNAISIVAIEIDVVSHYAMGHTVAHARICARFRTTNSDC